MREGWIGPTVDAILRAVATGLTSAAVPHVPLRALRLVLTAAILQCRRRCEEEGHERKHETVRCGIQRGHTARLVNKFERVLRSGLAPMTSNHALVYGLASRFAVLEARALAKKQ